MNSQILLVSLLALTLAGPALGAALGLPRRSAPNCASFLRILYPERFRHCDCTYSEWSEWSVVPNSVVSVSTTACESGEAYSETRSRTAASEGCDPQTETRQTCLPDPEDRLILALGLGNLNGGSNNPNPQVPVIISQGLPGIHIYDSDNSTLIRQKRLSMCPAVDPEDDPWVCTRFHEKRSPGYTWMPQVKNTRKRSLHEEYHHFRSTEKTEDDDAPKQLSSTPLPFDWNLHHSRFRRQTVNQRCYPNGKQHVLFLLDTSGSIGHSNWNRITATVSTLTALFCKPVQVAVMTFNHQFKLEFCFNCFNSNMLGRTAARNAIHNIPYRSGLTYSAGATLCACEELLHPNCGLHPYANCIDVVYITDGRSNDRTREVCDEVRCLHNHNVYGTRINTYAIGIGSSIHRPELDCIDNYSGVNSAFLFSDFIAFENAIEKIIDRLFDPNNSQYTCANPDGSLSR